VRKISIVFKGKKFKLKKKTVNLKFKDTEMKVLDLKKKKIDLLSNLEGFDEIPDIEALILDNNRLSEIDMAQNLNNLKFLSFKNNNIRDIKSLKGLRNLIELDLTGNEITNISGLENLPNLQLLRLGNNKIVQINNLEHLHNLEVLILDHNLITEIENLESLTNLSFLNLNDNDIKEVKNLDGLQNLRRIYLRNNWITKLLPIHLQNIEMVDIYGNPLYIYMKTRFEKIDTKIIVEYSLDPEGLENRLMVGMRNIHVPINISDLTSALIGSDNILYSTFCKVRSVSTGTTKRYISEWTAHVLITETGIAFTKPQRRLPPELKFYRWSDFWRVRSLPSAGTSAVEIVSGVTSYLLKLAHIKELESYQAFQNRLQYFPELCVSLKKWSEEEDYGENYFAMLTDIKEGVKLPYFYKNGKKAFKSKEWIKNPNKAKKNLKTIWQY